MSGEVPFKDFLAFLFQSSASKSAQSPHFSHRTNRYQTSSKALFRGVNKPGIQTAKENPSHDLAKTKPVKVQTSQRTIMHKGKVKGRSLSSTDGIDPEANISLLSTTVLIGHEVPSNETQIHDADELGRKNAESHQITVHQSISRLGQEVQTYTVTNYGYGVNSSGLNEKEVQLEQASSSNPSKEAEFYAIESHPLTQTGLKVSSVDEFLGMAPTNLNSVQIHKAGSNNSSCSSDTHQELTKSTEKESGSCSISNNNDTIDLQDNKYEPHPRAHDDLCGHDRRKNDLSFFKNFSATTRSKSSLLEEYLSFSLSDNDSPYHHNPNHNNYPYSHNIKSHDPLHKEHILSKRLSRSTPMNLDAIYVNNSSLAAGLTEDEERLLHQHHQQLEQFFRINNLHSYSADEVVLSSDYLSNYENEGVIDTEDGEKRDSCESSSPAHEESPENHDKSQDFNLVVLSGKLRSPARNGSVSYLGVGHTHDQSVKVSEKHDQTTPLASSPTHFARNISTTPSPIHAISNSDQINESKKRSGSSPSDMRSGPLSDGRTTTVTVTMDSTSLFLDTVYVNVKQNIDTASTIKLYY
jgi:hypothetical protein